MIIYAAKGNQLQDVSGYSFEDMCKWYEYETDITAVSKEFPSELITVTGYGEESGDIWRGYAINGQWQKEDAVITFAPCKLKTPETEKVTIVVKTIGGTVEVELECIKGLRQGTQYKLAVEKLKAAL